MCCMRVDISRSPVFRWKPLAVSIAMVATLCAAAMLVQAVGGIFDTQKPVSELGIDLLMNTDQEKLETAVPAEQPSGNSSDCSVELPDFSQYGCNFTMGDTLDYIETDLLSPQEIVLAQSLQGIVAKTKVQIYLKNKSYQQWFDMLVEDYGIRMNRIDSLWELVDKYKGYIRDNGYVLYTQYADEATARQQQSINSACTIAGIENFLVVEKSLESLAQEHGFVKKDEGTYELDTFDKYKKNGKLGRNFVISENYTMTPLRDFGIATGSMFYYEDYRQGYIDVISYLKPNSMLLGWHRDEPRDVSLCSAYGVMTEPSDWVENLTVFASLPKEGFYKAKEVSKKEIAGRQDVHYITFMMSDGDNLSYLQGAPTTAGKYGSPRRGEIPFGSTMASSTAALSPLFPKYYYKTATNNDSFIAALGAGYIHAATYPKEQYSKFAALTASWMRQLDLQYLLLADETINAMEGSFWEDQYRYVLEEMAQYPNIKGGALSYGVAYVPRAQKEQGGVMWVNGKPFVTNRDVLWAKNGTSPSDLEKAQVAYKINQYERDIHKIEGYSFYTVHTWSWTYEDVCDMVSMLDDNVVVVTPNEFFELIATNVPKKDVRHPDTPKYEELDYSEVKPFVATSFIDREYVAEMKATADVLFTFQNSGTQGWVPVAMNGSFDEAKLGIWGNKNVLLLNGYNYGTLSNTPNAYFMNKLSLPADAARLEVDLAVQSANFRVQVLDENGELTTLSDGWETIPATADFKKRSYDIARFKGQTVTIFLEQKPIGQPYGNQIAINRIAVN